MKKVLALLAIAALAACSKKAPEPVVNLNGFQLGISQDQLMQAVPELKAWSIGGVSAYFVHQGPGFSINPKAGLDALDFYFPSSGFAKVVEAVSSKYPGLACKDGKASHPNGTGNFDQTVCTLRVQGGELVIKRVYGDAAISALMLYSDAYAAEDKKRGNKR